MGTFCWTVFIYFTNSLVIYMLWMDGYLLWKTILGREFLSWIAEVNACCFITMGLVLVWNQV